MRILVTGIGVVSPLGVTAPATMDALTAGHRALGPLTLFDPAGCRSTIAAQVADLRVGDVAPAEEAEHWSRTDAMAVLAAREALTDLDQAAPVDLVIGGTTAGMFETEGLLAEMHRDPEARRPLEKMLSHPLSATADRLREVVRPFGKARTICSACSSGANALALAAAWLRAGRSERVLAGGADGLCRLTYVGFSCLGALSPNPCRPFDASREGLNLGEAAAFLLLETEAAARARGARPIVELRGWAVGAEAHHITNPEPSGVTAARVMAEALARAELPADAIDYVNAHGTATRLNDAMEAAAIRRCFGDRAATLPVSSSKGQIGHTLGAAGAIEAAICALAIDRGVVPPTAGLAEIDPDCVLEHVLEQGQPRPIRAAMSNSFGFGGSDAAIVLTAPDAFAPPAPPKRKRVYVAASGSVGPLGTRGSEADGYFAPGPPAPEGPTDFDAGAHLDLDRARRIDRAGRLAATAMQTAVGSLLDPTSPRAGAIVGTAFGTIDACAAFIHRFYEKGARFASPAIFPNLLPSSPVAHAAIYLGLGGIVFANADLGATAESAFVTAAELIAADEADVMLAGGVEEHSPLVEAVLGPLCSSEPREGARAEGTAVLLLTSEEALAERRPIAEVRWSASWRGDGRAALANLPPPEGRAVVALASDDGDLLAETPWATVPRRSAATRAGRHECAGGFAAAAALAAIAKGELDAALVVGLAPDRGYALLLGAEKA